MGFLDKLTEVYAESKRAYNDYNNAETDAERAAVNDRLEARQREILLDRAANEPEHGKAFYKGFLIQLAESYVRDNFSLAAGKPLDVTDSDAAAHIDDVVQTYTAEHGAFPFTVERSNLVAYLGDVQEVVEAVTEQYEERASKIKPSPFSFVKETKLKALAIKDLWQLGKIIIDQYAEKAYPEARSEPTEETE